jgi:hypothetical protein
MATFLDIGLLHKFDLIFPFLFVLLLMWGVLSQSKFLGENKVMHGLIALILGLLCLFSETLRAVINSMAPWFVLLFVFAVLLLLGFKTFGSSDVDIKEDFGWVTKVFFVLAAIIFAYSVINVTVWDKDTEIAADVVSGGKVGDTGPAGFFAVMRHPAVLGLITILLIATFTIKRLAESH